MAEPERGDRQAALLRFVDADVSPVTTQTPARSWSSNSPPAHPKISTEDWLNAHAATRGVALERSKSVLDRVAWRTP